MFAQGLDKPITRKFKKSNVYSKFKDTLCYATELSVMEYLSSDKQDVKYCCVS